MLRDGDYTCILAISKENISRTLCKFVEVAFLIYDDRIA